MPASPRPAEGDRADHLKTLAGLIKDQRICMLTTLDDDGTPWSRPMGVQESEFDGDLWFFTYADSEKSRHVERNPKVGVAFSTPDDQQYVTLAGRASISNDRAKISDLWNEAMKTWFPDGKDDPNLRLIHFTADRAEYWDSPATGIVYALGYTKAVLTGQPPGEVIAGENEKVDL